MTDIVFIYATAPSREVADLLADGLVTHKLAACVNMFDGMRSVYRWEGKLERAQEVAMIIKTTKAKVAVIKELFAKEHPYDTPALVVLDVADGQPDYLNWIFKETL